MDKEISIYDLHDPQQYEDEKEYWSKRSPEEKLHALEIIRNTGQQFLKSEPRDGDEQRLRRILRIVK